MRSLHRLVVEVVLEDRAPQLSVRGPFDRIITPVEHTFPLGPVAGRNALPKQTDPCRGLAACSQRNLESVVLTSAFCRASPALHEGLDCASTTHRLSLKFAGWCFAGLYGECCRSNFSLRALPVPVSGPQFLVFDLPKDTFRTTSWKASS